MLSCDGICKKYYNRNTNQKFTVLDNCSLQLDEGECVGIMGQSGSGKTTLARIFLRLIEPDAGKVFFEGQDITALKGSALKPFRSQVQLISQRPESFFDPIFKLGKSLREPLKIFNRYDKNSKENIKELLELVQLNTAVLDRYPHQVSGGEIQRLSIARALLLKPKVLVLDEPTSMLDISVQAQILHLLKDIQKSNGLTYMLIAHDKAVCDFLCSRIVRIEKGVLKE